MQTAAAAARALATTAASKLSAAGATAANKFSAAGAKAASQLNAARTALSPHVSKFVNEYRAVPPYRGPMSGPKQPLGERFIKGVGNGIRGRVEEAVTSAKGFTGNGGENESNESNESNVTNENPGIAGAAASSSRAAALSSRAASSSRFAAAPHFATRPLLLPATYPALCKCDPRTINPRTGEYMCSSCRPAPRASRLEGGTKRRRQKIKKGRRTLRRKRL